MKNHLISLALCAGAIGFCGCTTVAIYQTPVAQFQTAVNSANSGIRTYLLGINDTIAKGSLYTQYRLDANWTPDNFTNCIPNNEIQVRLQALGTISTYANALVAMTGSKDVANLQQAAKILGTNVNDLDATFKSLDTKNKWFVDLGDPVTSLVDLAGTLHIEHAQNAALEKAIIDGSTNVDAIIDRLKLDAKIFPPVISVFEGQIWTGKLSDCDKMLKTADPKDVDSLVHQCLADYDSIQSLKNAQMESLLGDMENAHMALVVFAKSGKSPKDLSDLTGQIDVFAAHVQLFNNALAAIQLAINPSK